MEVTRTRNMVRVIISPARSVCLRRDRGKWTLSVPDHGRSGFYLRHIKGLSDEEIVAIRMAIDAMEVQS